MRTILVMLALVCAWSANAQNSMRSAERKFQKMEKQFAGFEKQMDMLESVLDKEGSGKINVKYDKDAKKIKIKLSDLIAQQRKTIIRKINKLPREVKQTKLIKEIKKTIKNYK